MFKFLFDSESLLLSKAIISCNKAISMMYKYNVNNAKYLQSFAKNNNTIKL